MLPRWEPYIPPCRRKQLIKNSSFVVQFYLYVAAPKLETLVDEVSREPVIVAAWAMGSVRF